MRALLFIALGVGVIVGGFAIFAPGAFNNLGPNGLAQFVYLLLALALMGGGYFGIQRARPDRRWPLYILIWCLILAAAMVLARLLGRA